MHKRSESGFSLIELILAMAISSSLAVIAFQGQRALRSQADFDSSINKVVSTINDARNEATAGVNIIGTGDGSAGAGGGCAASTPGKTIFRGTSWTFDNTVGSPIKIDYYKSTPGTADVCSFQTQSYLAGGGLSMKVGATPKGRVLFVRTDTGALDVCPSTGLVSVLPVFKAGSCANASVTFSFTDTDGHKSQVLVDGSGLAKRLN